MTGDCIEELVHTESEDGFRLDGVVIGPPARAQAKPLAVVWTHGLYATFYHPPYVETGRALAGRGFASVIGNNRGHDFGAALVGMDGESVRCAGGGWERYHESPRDVGAWIAFAVGLGFRGVALVGHSLGARKAAYYQAERQDPRVMGLILASAGMAFLDPPERERELQEIKQRAERMVSEGHGRELVGWPPAGCSMSAQTLVEGEGSFQKIFFTLDGSVPSVARVRCPVLAFYGSTEKTETQIGASFEAIRQSARAASRVETQVIEGADHVYTGREREVAEVIAGWIDSL